MKKNKRKKKRAKKLIRFFIILVLLAAGVISFCLFTPFFNLTEITVVGCDQLTEEQIITSSGIVYGENIFKINKNKVLEGLYALPEIKSVKMTRLPLSKIKLTVTETYPCYVFRAQNGYAITDDTGKVMSITDSAESSELPLVSGIEAENAKISEKISVQDTIKFDIIIENLTLLKEKGIINELSAIDFTDLSSTQGYLKSGAKVIFGKLTDLDYKLSMLLAILPQIDVSTGAYIDLTIPENAFYGKLEDIEPEASEEPIDDSSKSSANEEAENTEPSE